MLEQKGKNKPLKQLNNKELSQQNAQLGRKFKQWIKWEVLVAETGWALVVPPCAIWSQPMGTWPWPHPMLQKAQCLCRSPV